MLPLSPSKITFLYCGFSNSLTTQNFIDGLADSSGYTAYFDNRYLTSDHQAYHGVNTVGAGYDKIGFLNPDTSHTLTSIVLDGTDFKVTINNAGGTVTLYMFYTLEVWY